MENYNFATCIEDSVASDVGCNPIWRINSVSQLPYCTRYKEYRDFMNKMTQLAFMDMRQLKKESDCLKPCNYIEYKVNIFLKLFMDVFYLKAIVFSYLVIPSK